VKSFQEWLKEGEDLYSNALSEFQALETQIEELEKKLAEKKAELNQIAQVVGKSPVESNRRVAAQIIDPERQQAGTNTNSAAAIARAITGRSIGR
jgi:t-SNARE complex subunit (syntaxin)